MGPIVAASLHEPGPWCRLPKRLPGGTTTGQVNWPQLNTGQAACRPRRGISDLSAPPIEFPEEAPGAWCRTRDCGVYTGHGTRDRFGTRHGIESTRESGAGRACDLPVPVRLRPVGIYLHHLPGPLLGALYPGIVHFFFLLSSVPVSRSYDQGRESD